MSGEPDKDGEKLPVVLVHGILVRGYAMQVLASRLRALGYPTHVYSYHSLRYPLQEQARRLEEWCQGLGLKQAHFVAHSMGGLVLRHFAAMTKVEIRSAVTISSPHRGGDTARAVKSGWLGWLLSKTIEQGLDGDLPPWPAHIPLGGLSGDRSIGLGRLFKRFDGPNDGTVAVEETGLPQMLDRCVLHHSHFGILQAAETASEIDHFFRQHCFSACR